MIIKYCTGCNDEIHPKRLEILPNTTKCVGCSDVKKKGSITVMKGTGDHTWVETIPLEPEEYEKYIELENQFRKKRNVSFDPIDKPTLDTPFGFHTVKKNKNA
jgi:hypothetical protein